MQTVLAASGVRISVANLVRKFETGASGPEFRVGILNPKHYNERGFKLLQPFGGGALLTRKGRKDVEHYYKARDFEGEDARFVVPSEFADDAVEVMSHPRYGWCEFDVGRELTEELVSNELNGIASILTEAEAKQLRPAYQCSVLQPAAAFATDTSPNARAGMTTRRIFHLHDVWAPEALVMKILASPATHRFTIDELRTTKGGTCRGTTECGVAIANNVWYY